MSLPVSQHSWSSALLIILLLAGEDAAAQADRVRFAVQGFTMRMRMMNVGAFGKVSCPPFSGGGSICAAESLGLEYPVGQQIEHIYGGGIWIGGLVDTSRAGNQTPLRLVSLTYEGSGNGPTHEFYPGPATADSFWTASRFDTTTPPGWEEYWGTSLPFAPISDADYHCVYTDNDIRVPGHVPLGLKVIQSSYAWNDPYADAILIFKYRIVNIGRRRIDSAYVGYSVDADVGPATLPAYYTHNSTGYVAQSRTAYVQNAIDEGSTPIGFTLLSTTKPLDSLRYTFQWFPLFSTPPNDRSKYDMMSSGVIRPDEFPAMSDTRFLFSFGPFTLLPSAPGRNPDTLTIAVAVVSGFSRRIDHRLIMQRNAARALDIYLNQGIRLPATPPSPPLRVTAGFRRVDIDWRWRPGDDGLFGRPDPELNWDSTNQVARRYPYRYERPPEPPPGIDTARGGRNFEAYRLWRSEDPKAPE